MMDTLLVNGDIGVSHNGEYQTVQGINEVLQKLMLCAKIRKGSFIYNKTLGTELAGIDLNSSNALKTAGQLLNEAIVDDYGFVAEAEKIEKSEDKIILLFSVSDGKETRKAEVKISADL